MSEENKGSGGTRIKMHNLANGCRCKREGLASLNQEIVGSKPMEMEKIILGEFAAASGLTRFDQDEL